MGKCCKVVVFVHFSCTGNCRKFQILASPSNNRGETFQGGTLVLVTLDFLTLEGFPFTSCFGNWTGSEISQMVHRGQK